MVEKGESRTPIRMPGSLVGLLGLGHKQAQRSAKRIALCAFCASLWVICVAHDHRLHYAGFWTMPGLGDEHGWTSFTLEECEHGEHHHPGIVFAKATGS